MQDSYALELVTGQDAGGRPCYQVVLLPAERVEDLRRNLMVKAVELEEYGEVLASGEGHEPPEGLIDELRGLLVKK